MARAKRSNPNPPADAAPRRLSKPAAPVAKAVPPSPARADDAAYDATPACGAMTFEPSASHEAFPPDAPGLPKLGMVCLSSDQQCSFRSITRQQFLKLDPDEQAGRLLGIYWENTQRLHWTLGYCARRKIALYRATSGLYPMSDEPLGRGVLTNLPATLSSVGRRAERLGIRMLLHPDQFVVLNSETPATVETSRKILDKHALWFDLFGLAQTPWNAINLHGGKGGRADELVAVVADLPDNVRRRLTFENDEYSYSAEEILAICRRTGCPMVFDCHHHVIREKLDSYDHPSVAYFTRAARDTWPKPGWQVCHVSNGETAFRDRYHALHVTMMPRAFRDVPWLEVEARGKEQAILRLRLGWPTSGDPPPGFPLEKPTGTTKARKHRAGAEI